MLLELLCLCRML